MLGEELVLFCSSLLRSAALSRETRIPSWNKTFAFHFTCFHFRGFLILFADLRWPSDEKPIAAAQMRRIKPEKRVTRENISLKLVKYEE